MGSRYLFDKTISNNYLGKSKTIKASTLWELDKKVKEQLNIWKRQEALAKEKERVNDAMMKAELMTIEAKAKIEEFKNILSSSLSSNYIINWNNLKRESNFPDYSFNKVAPSLDAIFRELKVPKVAPFIELFFSSIRRDRENLERKAQDIYNMKIQEYENEKNAKYNKYISKKNTYIKEVDLHNSTIDGYMTSFDNGEYDIEAIERYAELVLENCPFPDEISICTEVQYQLETKTLIVLFKLPAPKDIPNITEYKFIKTRKEITPKFMKAKEFEDFYDSIIYQSALKANHVLYKAYYIPYIDNIVFNGWVEYIDKATGKICTSCILSLRTNKKEFEEIDLQYVDYKECVRALKALYAGKLINLAPVQPIQDINKKDKRFVESKEILASINSTTNLATMDWEDFEHLVRELFEKEFCESGSEVKVTQASRDGGIDAVIFNPDPLKGGKIVIQAKRYNNVVPVSAARELSAVMQDEGAMKGILVTTSYYGKDSYEFVKDKPLTLIDGQELLFYFNKHGYGDINIQLIK